MKWCWFIVLLFIIWLCVFDDIKIMSINPNPIQNKHIAIGETIRETKLLQHVQMNMPVYSTVVADTKAFILEDTSNGYLVYLPDNKEYGYINPADIKLDK